MTSNSYISKPLPPPCFAEIPEKNKIAICLGINNYPDKNKLQGCINDATAWGNKLFLIYNYYVYQWYDQDVTLYNVVGCIKDIAKHSTSKTNFVLTYSGHGTNVADQNNDELDNKDEAMCFYDGLLLDDTLGDLLKEFHPESTITIISDSCFSGTNTRAQANTYAKARYMQQTSIIDYMKIPVKKSKSPKPEEYMREVLISGCLESEYSYDAMIDNRYQGAFTNACMQILNKTPDISFNSFYDELRKKLPNSQYPQTPQLEGSIRNKSRKMFT